MYFKRPWGSDLPLGAKCPISWCSFTKDLDRSTLGSYHQLIKKSFPRIVNFDEIFCPLWCPFSVTSGLLEQVSGAWGGVVSGSKLRTVLKTVIHFMAWNSFHGSPDPTFSKGRHEDSEISVIRFVSICRGFWPKCLDSWHLLPNLRVSTHTFRQKQRTETCRHWAWWVLKTSSVQQSYDAGTQLEKVGSCAASGRRKTSKPAF